MYEMLSGFQAFASYENESEEQYNNRVMTADYDLSR